MTLGPSSPSIHEVIYRVATDATTPLRWLSVWRSTRRGKAPQSLAEKMGRATAPRPAGPLLCVAARGLGEIVMAQPVIERILAQYPALNLLVTPRSLDYRTLFARMVPPGTTFQRAPFNTPSAARRFYAYWRPDFVLWICTNPKPNLILESRRYGTGHAILQADLGADDYARQRRFLPLFGAVYRSIQLVGARSNASAERFRGLGVADVLTLGDLRNFGSPLPVDPGELQKLHETIGGRPCWVAASTHHDEPLVAARLHRALAQRQPHLLTIIAPRNAPSGARSAELLRELGFKVSRRA